MSWTDTSEGGLESLIFHAMTGRRGMPTLAEEAVLEPDQAYDAGTGWYAGDPSAYDPEYTVDLEHLGAFLVATQGDVAEALDLYHDSPTRRQFLARLSGKRLIISTVQKFPHVLDDIGNEHRHRRFAILIDEAHSSQGGRTSAAMSLALSEAGEEGEEETPEDRINRIMVGRKLLPNASYFAFTATPKGKTLELFGEPFEADGKIKHRPIDEYTMKQAIEERFILDVLKSFTPISSYYRLIKTVEDDPEFDTRKARKKLRRYVESHDHAIGLKAEIMVDHFHQQVIGRNKIGGQARAMVVTSGIERASAIAWTRSSTPAWRPTTRRSTRTARSSSRARPRRSCAPTSSWPRFFPTPRRSGRSYRSS